MTSSENGTTQAKAPQQIAVWYFVAATFVFASTTLWFRGAELWMTIAIFAVGMVLVVLGGLRLGVEWKAWRAAKRPPEG